MSEHKKIKSEKIEVNLGKVLCLCGCGELAERCYRGIPVPYEYPKDHAARYLSEKAKVEQIREMALPPKIAIEIIHRDHGRKYGSLAQMLGELEHQKPKREIVNRTSASSLPGSSKQSFNPLQCPLIRGLKYFHRIDEKLDSTKEVDSEFSLVIGEDPRAVYEDSRGVVGQIGYCVIEDMGEGYPIPKISEQDILDRLGMHIENPERPESYAQA